LFYFIFKLIPNGRNVINISVNEGLLGEESSMKMNLPFDRAKK